MSALSRSLTAFLLAGSCGAAAEAVPGHATTLRCEAQDCSAWAVSEVQEVLDDADARWRVLFDRPVCPPTEIVVEDAVLLGLKEGYHARGVVHVAAEDAPGTWPLVHEVVHASLWCETGDGDADHVDGDGPWTSAHDLLIETATR